MGEPHRSSAKNLLFTQYVAYVSPFSPHGSTQHIKRLRVTRGNGATQKQRFKFWRHRSNKFCLEPASFVHQTINPMTTSQHICLISSLLFAWVAQALRPNTLKIHLRNKGRRAVQENKLLRALCGRRLEYMNDCVWQRTLDTLTQ